jgi:hypothetical protein
VREENRAAAGTMAVEKDLIEEQEASHIRSAKIQL